MPSTRTIINAKDVEAATKLAEAGGPPDGKVHEWLDQSNKGLTLRLRGKKVVWICKTNSVAKLIGVAFPRDDPWKMTAPTKAREVHAHVKAILKDDPTKIDSFLAAFHATKDVRQAIEAMKPKPTTWSLMQCVEQYIEDKTAENAEKPIKPKTVKDVRLTFNRPEFAAAAGTAASMLKRGEIEAVRNAVLKSAGPSSAKKVVAYTRAVLEHCNAHHSGLSGLETVPEPWWRMLSVPFTLQARTRRPTLEALAKSLVLAEHYLEKPLPGRQKGSAYGVYPGTLAGLWWIVLCCQRAEAAMSLLPEHVVPDPENPGWMLAAWDETLMKGGKVHVLPVPAAAWDLVDRIRQSNKKFDGSGFAFPSSRKPGVHVTQSGAYSILYKLAGRDGVSKKSGESRDLLAECGIDWWSMHDVRRSLTKAMDDAGIPGGSSVVLAHEVKDERNLDDGSENIAQRQARITRIAYGAAQNLALKRRAMEIWTSAVIGEYEQLSSQILSDSDKCLYFHVPQKNSDSRRKEIAIQLGKLAQPLKQPHALGATKI